MALNESNLIDNYQNHDDHDKDGDASSRSPDNQNNDDNNDIDNGGGIFNINADDQISDNDNSDNPRVSLFFILLYSQCYIKN